MAVSVGKSSIVSSNLILYLDAGLSDSFVINEVEVLVVAGGGAGGGRHAGGGGGGGVIYVTSYPVTPGTNITVTVGNGGLAGGYGSRGGNGQNSLFGSLTAIGGGGGGGYADGAATVIGASGGSGGGGAGAAGLPGGNGSGGAGTPGQGNRGGDPWASGWPGGGGGGAGQPGQSPRNGLYGGRGGDGLLYSISGFPRYYAGGGGGAGESNVDLNGGLGGLGGGGRATGAYNPSQGQPGEANTGGGGGGSRDQAGAVGGSGVVIVRYPGPQKATGGTITQVGGYTIHTFTSSGTFTPLTEAQLKSTFYGLQDLIGNTVSATALNGPTYNSGNGGYILFDGTNDLLDLGRNKEINLFTKDFAVCSWFYRVETGPEYGNLIGNYYTNSVAVTNDWQIMIRRTNPLQLGIYRVGTGYPFSATQSAGSTITTNMWVNIVLTRIDSNLSVYINGNLLQTVTNTDQWGNGVSSNMCIGIDGNKISEPFGGRISSILIYKDKGLSASEVQQNFNVTRGRFGI
jgi:hypothetical protein